MNVAVLMSGMAVAAFLGACGQMFLKEASLADSFYGMLAGWPIWAFAGTYGIAVLINIWAYRSGGKVAIIYPVIALSYIFASLLAWKLYGEPITGWTIAGTAVIVIGVGLIGYGAA